MHSGDELFGAVYERGAVIIREGDAGDTMYIIQSGAAEVRQRQGDRDVVLALLEKGDFFGEMALLNDEPRSATVAAIAQTRLLAISRNSLLSRLRQDPGVALHLLKTLSRRIEKNNRLLQKRLERGGGRPHFRPGPAPSDLSSASRHPMPLAEFFSEYDCLSADPGQVLFHEGEAGDALFVILEGRIEVVKGSGEEETVLARLGPGDYFGEMALITDLPRTASAVSIDRSRLLVIRRCDFHDRIGEKPELALYVLQTLIRRLKEINEALQQAGRVDDAAAVTLPSHFRKRGKMTVAIVSLSTCSGCASTLLGDQGALSEFLERVHVVYCPLLMDEHEFGQVDMVVVDGLVRSKEDERRLLEVREKCDTLVAWGTCASFGGIPAMANHYELEDLLEEAYGDTLDAFAYYLSGSRGTGPASYRDTELALLRRAVKLDDVVKVDTFVPGCPPRAGLLIDLITELQGEKPVGKGKVSVCAECGRRSRTQNPADCFRVFPLPGGYGNACFPSQGAFCLGFLTRGGCGAVCTSGGLPCWGCRGPSDPTLQKIEKGDTLERIMVDALAARGRLDEGGIRTIMNLVRNRANSALNYYAGSFVDWTRIR